MTESMIFLQQMVSQTKCSLIYEPKKNVSLHVLKNR